MDAYSNPTASMKKYALIILIPLLFTACTDEQYATTERVVRAGADAYYGRPAPTGYYQPVPQPVVTPVYPYGSY
jgi:hypothetical protein